MHSNEAEETYYSILDLAEENIIHTASVVFRNELFEKLGTGFKLVASGRCIHC